MPSCLSVEPLTASIQTGGDVYKRQAIYGARGANGVILVTTKGAK